MLRKTYLIFFSFVLVCIGEIVTLQNGLNGYNGCTDRAVVDTYNFMKTSWWLSEEAFSYLPNYSSPGTPQFAIAFFTC